MHKTKIDWCDYTWNPVWGCLNSCPYCYARATARRWGLSFEPHWRERNFNRPMPKEPDARIFVNSMSEMAYWKPEWWERVIGRIIENPQHTFIFLTQDPSIYVKWMQLPPRNCWLGATATTQLAVKIAQQTLALMRPEWITFLSIEPILQAIDPAQIDTDAVRWVILAAETGNLADRVVPPLEWIKPFLGLKIPLYMKRNIPWDGPWRKEFPA